MANFLSYLAGILNSYVFNRLWVFRSRENRYLREGAVFFFGAALCWALQWVAFRLLLLCLSERAAYLIGMCVYPRPQLPLQQIGYFQKKQARMKKLLSLPPNPVQQFSRPNASPQRCLLLHVRS